MASGLEEIGGNGGDLGSAGVDRFSRAAERDALFCWKHLWSPAIPGEKPRRIALDIPDTVLIGPDKSVERWIFTSGKTGEVLKKSAKTMGRDALRCARVKFGACGAHEDERGSALCAVAYFADGTKRALTREELPRINDVTKGRHFIALQKFIYPKRRRECRHASVLVQIRSQRKDVYLQNASRRAQSRLEARK